MQMAVQLNILVYFFIDETEGLSKLPELDKYLPGFDTVS